MFSMHINLKTQRHSVNANTFAKKAIKCLNAFEDNINTYKIHATQCVTGSFFCYPIQGRSLDFIFQYAIKKAATLDMTEIFSRH